MSPDETDGDRIDELERELAEIRTVRDRLERALEVSDTYAWDWDLETDTVVRHPSFEHLLGIDAAELEPLFENFLARVHPDHRESVEEAFADAAENGDAYRVRYPIRSGDDSWVWLDGRGEVVLDDDGSPTRILGTTRVIPEPDEG